MDIDDIRDDFPILDDVIYLDNACMSIKPRPVIDAVNRYYEEFPVCGGGRSTHTLASNIEKKIEGGRKAVKRLLNASHGEVAFTKNTTEAVNLVAKGLGLKRGDKVITTDKEHNSNLVPWIQLKDEVGIEYEQVTWDEEGELDLEELKEMMDSSVKVVSMGHTSNLDGTTIPAGDVADIVHDNDAIFMLDAAQSVPHRPVDVEEIDADLLCLSIHKMMGPTGVGALYGKKKVLEEIEPMVIGGGGVKNARYGEVTFHEAPARFESGLQNYAALCAVEDTIEYLEKLGLKNIQEQEEKLNRKATEELEETVNIIGPRDPGKRGGIFNFQPSTLGSHEVSLLLEEKDILTRGGMQCVHSWYNSRGLDGGVRASFYIYNTLEEVNKFVEMVKRFVEP